MTNYPKEINATEVHFWGLNKPGWVIPVLFTAPNICFYSCVNISNLPPLALLHPTSHLCLRNLLRLKQSSESTLFQDSRSTPYTCSLPAAEEFVRHTEPGRGHSSDLLVVFPSQSLEPEGKTKVCSETSARQSQLLRCEKYNRKRNLADKSDRDHKFLNLIFEYVTLISHLFSSVCWLAKSNH